MSYKEDFWDLLKRYPGEVNKTKYRQNPLQCVQCLFDLAKKHEFDRIEGILDL